MEKKGIGAIVLALIAVILLGVALFGTWYTIKNTTSMNYTLRECKAAGVSIEWTSDLAKGMPTQAALHTNLFYITIVALVLGIIGLITAAIAGVGKLSGKVAGAFLILTFIFALVATVYYAAALPGAMKEDFKFPEAKGFIGSEAGGSWGPSYGWVLAIAAFILALIGAILAFRIKKAPAVAPTPPPAAP